MAKKLDAKVRQEQFLRAGFKLAKKTNYMHVTRKAIADEVGCSQGLVSLHYNTMGQYRRSLMREAIRSAELHVIAQGILAKDSQAMKADAQLKDRAIAALAS